MPSPSWIERLLAGEEDGRAAAARAEIVEEIADHLDAAERRHRAAGTPPEEARRLAEAEFGDTARVAAECLWIRMGDQIMWRSLTVLVGVALCAIGSVLAYASFGAQRQMAEGLAQLSAQLAKLNERSPAEPALPARRATLRGLLYLGDPSRPAAQAEAEVRRLPDGQVIWPIRTDDDGRFVVVGLSEGQYFVMAALVGQPEGRVSCKPQSTRQRPPYQIQSAPFFIDALQEDVTVDIDVRFERCEVQVELDPSVTEEIENTAGVILNNLFLSMELPELISLPWTTEADIPTEWPARGRLCANVAWHRQGVSLPSHSGFYNFKPNGNIRHNTIVIPPGRRHFVAALYLGTANIQKGEHPDSVARFMKFAQSGKLIQQYIPSDDHWLPLDLPPNTRTRICLSAPGRAERLAQVLFNEQATDEELRAATAPEPMKVEILGQEPLEDAAP